MYIYNLKLNKNVISKLFIFLSFSIILAIIIYSFYIMFFNNTLKTSNSAAIIEINENNYTNILKAANEDIDSYIGYKVHVIGYVYRLLDFNNNQFVVARDMKYGEHGNSLVVGFLCDYKKASYFSDGTWVDITGEIVKGDFNGDIAMLKVISIKEATKPQNLFVSPPICQKARHHGRFLSIGKI